MGSSLLAGAGLQMEDDDEDSQEDMFNDDDK